MWKDLTMQQRAEVIKMAVQGGLRNLTDIRSFYDNSLKREDGGSLNSYKENQFAKGGNKPITTGGAGYIPNNPINSIKFNPKKVYNRVPGDGWYNFINENRLYNDGTADAIGGVKNYLFNDDNYVEKRLARYTPYKNITYREAAEAENKVFDEIRKARSRVNKLPERKRKYLEKLQDKADALTILQHEDAKDVYLGMPQRTGTLKPAEYSPTQGVLNNGMYVTYMREPSFIEDVIIPTYNNYQTKKVNKEGKKILGEVISFPKRVSNVNTITPKGNAVVNLPFLSNATMSKGYDKKGEYISIFDTWDYNTDLFATPGDNIGSSIKGKPFDIYDRYYLDDIYGVKEPTHAKYLPEVAVYGRNKKALGGKVKSSFVRSLETQPTILEQVAEYNKEPKVRKATKESYRQQRIREQKAANQRERNIAKHYLAAGPNIANLAKAAYHWYNSVPFLGGEPEDGSKMITGVVDVPGMRNPKSILKGASTVGKLITKANAAKITPVQWTAAQDAAIARGDMAEAQRLRDLHFRTYQNGDMVDVNGNPIHVYHGSPEENITEFYKPNDPRLPAPKSINFKATGEEGIYTSPRRGYAARYMQDLGGRYHVHLTKEQKELLKAGKSREEIGLPPIPEGRIYDLYSNTSRVPEDLDINFNPFTLSTEEANIIKSKGYSGFDIPSRKYPEHVVLEPNQLKSADAVTYNNGVRISLGERDNFNINDIRYAVAPILAGGIGYGAYRNQKASGGSIHIAPSKRGTFTAAASKHGMGVQEFASKVLANKEDYSSAMVKKANFARNASKWKH